MKSTEPVNFGLFEIAVYAVGALMGIIAFVHYDLNFIVVFLVSAVMVTAGVAVARDLLRFFRSSDEDQHSHPPAGTTADPAPQRWKPQ